MPEQSSETIPQELQLQIDKALDWIVEEAKKDYHNPLQPVQQFEEKIRIETASAFSDIFARNIHARDTLRSRLQKEEDENLDMAEEARLSTWENIFDGIQKKLSEGSIKLYSDENPKTIQEQCNISWKFLDRINHIAENLMSEGQYQDAAAIFDLLLFLHPFVQAYGFGKARALFGAELYDAALEQYKFCHLLDHENPSIFFEMARCDFQLRDEQQCLADLESCLRLCNQHSSYADLMAEASAVQQAIESKQLAV